MTRCITGRKSAAYDHIRESVARPLVYLATPYRSDDASTRVSRRDAAVQLESAMIDRGITIYNPVGYSLAVSVHRAGSDDEVHWLSHGLRLLAACDGMLVFQQPGWDESSGVSDEQRLAWMYRIPVTMLPYEYSDAMLDEVSAWASGLDRRRGVFA